MSELREREALHMALADAHRAHIVAELDCHPAGLNVNELARTLAVHPNTVRWHLGILADAGLVSSHPAARNTPGRPAIVYTLRDDPDAAGISSRDDHRLLATIAIGILSDRAGIPCGVRLFGSACLGRFEEAVAPLLEAVPIYRRT